MKRTLYAIPVIMAIIVLMVLSCKKEYSCEGCNTRNEPPVSIAGVDQSITLPTDSLLLSGSASYDPDGQITAWKWRKVSGPASNRINRQDSATTIAAILVQGIYQFELQVTDDKGASAKDTVQITVIDGGITNQPPVACAGPDQTITLPVNSTQLDGSCSTDPDNNITAYLWTKISGPSSFNIAPANAVQPQLTDLAEGIYLFQLQVTDAGGLFSLDTIKITVTDDSLVDIYIAGYDGRAKYWKNGQEVILPGGPQSNIATSIAVYNNDVYVAGEDGDPWFVDATDRAKYWKNGQEVFLTGPVGAGATSITVNNGDIYIAGWQYNTSGRMAKYWKNGQSVNLTNGTNYAHASCIVVVGNDVYVSGYENETAKYWKNGQAVSLTNGTLQSHANAITVVGTDIYVAGSESNDSVHVAKYWKNGQPVSLTNGSVHAVATSIAVVGNDVYVAGYEGGYYNMVAKCWKNGQEIQLTNQTGTTMATSIALFDNDVYVAGGIYGANTHVAKYWKNGQDVPLSGAPGSGTTSIVVVRR